VELQTEIIGADSTLLRINGRLDAATVDQVKRVWIEAEAIRHIVADLSQTSFIDSIGLATLVSGLKATRQRGGELILLNPSEAVKVILELTRMNIVFKIVSTIEEAKTHLT
jgi:anti-sigma B factor antagonist